jgi:hypothetical protein
MKMKRIIKITFFISAIMVFLASCTKDLNKGPIDPKSMTPANVYTNAAGYKQVLAKCYAGLAESGQQGPSGNPDIYGIDEGFGEYMRGYWYHQELTTDEAVIGWNDQTVKNFHYQDWGSGDVFIAAMYYRIFYQVSLCNEFIRESTDAKLDSRGITGTDKTNVQYYHAEARFLRALSYYHALDLFGNVPFVTEKDGVGKFYPPQIKRPALFSYIESELKAIEPLLVAPKKNEYARADQACAWTLLAKLYLNATVYNGTDRNSDCITYCQKVINAGYTLDPNYANLFLADNNLSPEIIFPVAYDGLRTQNYGGTTFIIHAAVGGSMTPANYGVTGGWAGTRTTKAFVEKFIPSKQKSFWSQPMPPKRPMTYPVLYVPGSYQPTAWTPSDPNTVLGSVNSDGKYEGYLQMPAGATFKFCSTPNWNNNWGYLTDSTLLRNGSINLSVVDAGYYKINVDTISLKYTVVKTTWSVVGTAASGDWNTDFPMTYDPTTDTWSTVLALVVGDIKFRANNAWTINYGGASGILTTGGANIAIPEAGNYTITIKLGHPDYTYSIVLPSIDGRAMFYTAGQSIDIKDITSFTDGYAISKWKNVTSTGAAGSSLSYADTDFPMFRLADVYLMYAEAVIRGGTGGDQATALTLVNDLRTRAYGNSTGNITASQLTLAFILDERARELYWECVRRTDLIRFGQFTNGTYVWQWKGNSPDGVATSINYNLFPLPSTDVSANPNLVQNPGY